MRVVTRNAAFNGFEENIKGSIEPGKLADLAILERNPLQVPAEEIGSIRVDGTLAGGRVVFHGGVDNQQTLPFGSPADVRREVEENIALFSPCKGYIVAPCHNIQANTPTANIVALYETVRNSGAS